MAKRKSAAPAGAASMNPDEMSAGGLPTDFDGTIDRVRLAPWNYAGKRDEFVLGVYVDISPIGANAEGEEIEPFRAWYSAGELDFFPSMDGEETVDIEGWDGDCGDYLEYGSDALEEVEGIYAVAVESRTQLSGSSNWAFFLRSAIKAGLPTPVEPNVDSLEGIVGHFNRVPQPRRPGVTDDDDRRRDILVITKVLDEAPAQSRAKSGRGRKTRTSARGRSKVDEDLEESLRELVLEALEEADVEEGLPKSNLGKLVLDSLKGKAKTEGVKRIARGDFLTSGHEDGIWWYDADEGVLYQVEDEEEEEEEED